MGTRERKGNQFKCFVPKGVNHMEGGLGVFVKTIVSYEERGREKNSERG